MTKPISGEARDVFQIANAETGDRRLRAARLLPAAVEGAFRAAVRESVFIRGERASFEATLQNRTSFHLDRLIREWSIPAPEGERARAAATSSVTRFLRSPLCRRLTSVPLERLHASPHSELDLLASSAGGKHFAIRFAGRANCVELLRPPQPIVTGEADLAALLLYDIAAERLHQLGRAAIPALLTA